MALVRRLLVKLPGLLQIPGCPRALLQALGQQVGGAGIALAEAKARDLYEQAAKRGNARAQCNLGFFYYHGISVEEDDAQAYSRKASSMSRSTP